jgi:hypothetical protein
MTLDLKRIVESKRRLRRQLAARPMGEKLAMLDALRERTLMLRGASHSAAVHEARGEYGTPAPAKNSETPPQT